MRRVQRLMGVADAKPASASLSTSPNNSNANSPSSSHPYPNTSGGSDAPIPSQPNFLAPPAGSSGAPSSQPATQQQQLPNAYSTPQPSPYPTTPGSFYGTIRASSQPNSPAPQQQYFDMNAGTTASYARPQVRSVTPVQNLVSRPVSPQAPGVSAAVQQDSQPVERPELHKSLKALETLLVNLDEYRDLTARLAKVEKKLVKSASELEKNKVMREAPRQTLQVASAMFEGLHEVSSKHAKQVQKEYEAVNDACAKYFKKVAKEERTHDELVENLDSKIKKANAAHEKTVKKATGNKALESHDKYIATVQSLTSEISRAKSNHASSMGAKSHVSSLMVASTIGGLADLEFRRYCETVRRIGPNVGKLNQWLCFTSSEYMPALQASEFDEAEQGQAEYLASLTAQVEAEMLAQAESNAKIQEDTQTILRAQQMGWKPPSPLATPATRYNNLDRSSTRGSSSRNVSGSSHNINPTPQSSSSANLSSAELPKLDSNGHPVSGSRADSRSRSNSNVDARSLHAEHSAEADARSIRSVATDRTPRQHEQPMQQQENKAALVDQTQSTNPMDNKPNSTLKIPNSHSGSSVRLDRAPTGSTFKSMAAKPETWEESSASGKDQYIDERYLDKKASLHGQELTDSSEQEGSVIDRLAVPRDGSDTAPPGLSASNSAQGSDDGMRAPRTPDDSEGVPIVLDRSESQAGTNSKSEDEPKGILENGDYVSTASSKLDGGRRPAELALLQYKSQTVSPVASPRTPFHRPHVATNGDYADQDQHEYASARKVSLWERERERMRQLEKEDELHRRLMEEQQPRNGTMGVDLYARPGLGSRAYSSAATTNAATAQTKVSDLALGERGGTLGMGFPQVGEGHEMDRYAPAVGSTRLTATGVTRSLSTDTTASERSFVARMKARYQAEKELEREHREWNVLEKERAARRVTMDPSLPMSSSMNARRVPEIAAKYQGPASSAPLYAQEAPVRRYHDSLPAAGGSSRLSAVSSAPSTGGAALNEFGAFREGRSVGGTSSAIRSTMPAGRSKGMMEAPHSDVCGCHQCSARHYGSGATAMDPAPQSGPPSSARPPRNPREYNVRRTTMPVPARGERQGDAYGKDQRSAPKLLQHNSYLDHDRHARDEQLYAPQQPSYGRRSHEDLHSGGDRKVMFSNEAALIR